MMYDKKLLEAGAELCPEVRGLIIGLDAECAKNHACEIIRLGCDLRIPRKAKGYIAQLAEKNTTRAIREDCVAQLASYVEII